MSNAPSTLDSRDVTDSIDRQSTGDADRPTTALPTLARSAGQAVTDRFRFAGFWSAVLLPLAYVPMLVGGVAASQPALFAALLAVHAAALVAGHDYHDD